ncbi:MAG: hypothetical protein WCW01_04680 [Gammaproteobacteria bacterium]
MSKATISQAVNTLQKKDYLFKDKQGFLRMLDPLVKYILAQEE